VIVADGTPPSPELEEARREAAYYRRIAEEAGSRRLREAEALSHLLARAEQAERALARDQGELERRVELRTRELTEANERLSRVVAERARAEGALRAGEEVFRSFMAHFPGLAYIKEADTRVVFANEGFRTYLGVDPATLTGQTNAGCFPEPFASAMTADDLRVLASGGPERIPEEFAGRSWISHKFVIPLADGGRRLGGFTLDVTEARRGEEERRRLELRVEQAQRIDSLGVLAGGIAHDFNNLLATVLSNVALLRARGAAAPDADACLADVEAAARTAAGLCQQMLAYAGRSRFAPEPVDLGAVVRGVIPLLRASMSHRLSVDLQLAEPLPLVRGEPSQLRQVVMNLVINAAEAIGEGPGTLAIRTAAAQLAAERLGEALLGQGLAAGDYVTLDVEDTGCGMDASTQRRIFEPFFSTKFAGRGLGLSAVLGIVRQLGGAIELDSAPGRGTRFRVLLPALDAAGAAAAPAAPPEPPRGPEGWTGHGRVLVVDDEPGVRRAVGRLLGHLGFEAVEAESGAQALALHRPGAFVAVLLDLTMPSMDGVETLRRLRQLDPGVFVMIASGFAAAEVEDRFRGEPPDGFVQKPFDVDALRDHLRAAVQRAGRGG
jgi:signal transduction histidine kinase